VRLLTVAFTAVAGAAIVLLSACSGASESNSGGLPQTSTDVARKAPRPVPLATGSFLYVADYSKDSIEILQRLHQRFTNVGQIKESVLDPLGVWVDRSQNLYVANGLGPVSEYDSSGKLIFEYESAGSGKNVTADKSGNVYVAGVDVNEYPQGIDTAFSCEMPNAAPRSVAVDKDGDVFVGASQHDAKGKIVEYVHGLVDSKCKPTRLPINFSSVPSGIAFDKEGNLLATDPDKGVGDIDVIAPPYTSITRKISARGPWPVSVTINKINTRIYVADSFLDVVHVLSYPAGASVATLGSDQNLSQPVSAVDRNNYVP
jgi:DNA-binding beta-propeller fold protein YncE